MCCILKLNFYLLSQIHSCHEERETFDNSIFNNNITKTILTQLSYQYRRCENIELIHTNLGKPEIIHNVDTTRYVATFGCRSPVGRFPEVTLTLHSQFLL